MVVLQFCTRKVRSSSLTLVITFFFAILVQSRGVGVRILFKNGHFSAAFLSHETSLSVIGFLSSICPINAKYRRVPEMGQKFTFIKFYLPKNCKILIFSKMPRSKLMIFIGYTVLMSTLGNPPSKVCQNYVQV